MCMNIDQHCDQKRRRNNLAGFPSHVHHLVSNLPMHVGVLNPETMA
jgi:hypothetical protein